MLTNFGKQKLYTMPSQETLCLEWRNARNQRLVNVARSGIRRRNVRAVVMSTTPSHWKKRSITTMKISLKHYDQEITIETEGDGQTIQEALDLVHSLLVAAGYTFLANGELIYEEQKTPTQS